MRHALLAVVILTLAAVKIGACECADEGSRVLLQFEKPYQAYKAVCLIGRAGPLTVSIEKDLRLVRRFTLKTITQPMVIRPVRLEARNHRDVQGLFVICAGGSASHVNVFEISASRPYARQLLYNYDKGGVDYGYDHAGRLRGLRFHYYRWHVDNQRVSLSGHVFTAVDYKWLPERRMFRKGNVHVDREAEQQASLLDLLSAIGSDEFLPVAWVSDANYHRIAYYYHPVGILRDKTPRELRDAPEVKVEVRYVKRQTSWGMDEVPRITRIARAG